MFSARIVRRPTSDQVVASQDDPKHDSADPKMLTPSNKAIIKLPNSNINDDIGKAKELSFDPLEGRDNLRETNVPRSNRQKNSDQEGNSQYQSNTKNPEFQSKNKLGRVKELYFDLLKRNSDKKMTKLSPRTRLRQSLDFEKNLGMVKDLYFNLFKRGPIPSKKDDVRVQYLKYPHIIRFIRN